MSVEPIAWAVYGGKTGILRYVERDEDRVRELVEEGGYEARPLFESTPPADDVREALAKTIQDADDYLHVWQSYLPHAERILSDPRFEVRPRGTVTAAEPAGLCSQCGEPFGEHSCVPIPSCIHVGPILAEARPHGTVTDAEVEAAAQAIYEDLGGEWPWSSLTSSFQESYLSNARAALEAAREVHP